ncbi:TPR repeat-containing thioredoxin TTL4-like [Impatiens glandulifera]|uniref:TPR repeat-containing thioredoxin TTL4-like n=1 Tax=Impatiens glandulifera TaxID=253017 RepID=UPI001FB17EFF|nr:TPR repeat-containing thioredoxin TTL4-like [Impatiens glandulifera]
MGEDSSHGKKLGCGLLGAMFGRRHIGLKTSVKTQTATAHIARTLSAPTSKRRRDSDDLTSFSDDTKDNKQLDRIIPRPTHKTAPSSPKQKVKNRQNSPAPVPVKSNVLGSVQGYSGSGKKVPEGTIGISGELESMLADHRKGNGVGKLIRASSGNVMLLGNLGNLRQPAAGNSAGGGDVYSGKIIINYLEMLKSTTNNTPLKTQNEKYPNAIPGNVVTTKNNDKEEKLQKPTRGGVSFCRALSTRADPEHLKILGNEDYKNGRFAEALALYDAAISIDPTKASYRSNKSAALTAMGSLLEAVFECREAIRIEPSYQRAHNRLSTLYLRLGEVEKTIYHYKHAGGDSDPDVFQKAKKLQSHLNKCTEAKKHRDWNTLLKESILAISSGADSAQQIFALQAEALLKLHKHDEADKAMLNAPDFTIDDCTKFFGPIAYANLLIIRAQIDLTAGRFDDAVAIAMRALKLDSMNKEVSVVVNKTKSVAMARSRGNELFRDQRYSDACDAYGEGLDHDRYNSVLLCNRGICRLKLGQIEKAIDDFTAALNLRPSYRKARLRRAECNSKLEKWEACLQDYRIMSKETPDDLEISSGLKEVERQAQQAKEKDDNSTLNDATLVVDDGTIVLSVTDKDQFREYVLQGTSVVLFCNKGQNVKETLQFMDQLSRKYQRVNFYKVEMEEIPSLEKSEGIKSLPTVKIYKNGSRTKDISTHNLDLLDSSIKFHVT